PSSRGSNSYSIGGAIRMRLKSECSGFKRKFLSSGPIALGTARIAERCSSTHRSPISIVSAGGGEILQFAGHFFIGRTSVRLSDPFQTKSFVFFREEQGSSVVKNLESRRRLVYARVIAAVTDWTIVFTV